MQTTDQSSAREALHAFYKAYARRSETVPGDYLSLLLPAFTRLHMRGCRAGQEHRRLFGLMTDTEVACAFHWLHCWEECGSGWESAPWTRCGGASRFARRGPLWYEMDKDYAYNEAVRRFLRARRAARLPWQSPTPDVLREWIEASDFVGGVMA